ncbi:MAG TPA: tetratricopeptide repeat protein [Gammaproteobacteria bacterium]|nr:tetratricopeptide repeat protein [Gammaproteobacteria bacterium]
MAAERADRIRSLEALLARGQDSALLRFSLGGECLKAGDPAAALAHLRRAVEQDPAYSAAWKLLGKAATQTGDAGEAMLAYRRGIEVAEAKGDRQAAKEMRVFLRRLEKQGGMPPPGGERGNL